MSSRSTATGSAADADRLAPAVHSAAQTRILTAARELFAEHGVSGTSLQMIADSVGVTKAAVYHQFKTKEAIVVALVDMELGQLQLALDAAQEGRGGPDELVALMTQVIDLAVSRRRMVRTLLYDPVIVRLLAEHRPYQVFMRRLFGALLGGATDPKARVRAAMVASAIGGVVTHPLVAALDDSTLRAELIDLAQRLM